MVRPCIGYLARRRMGPASRRAVACCCCRAACMTYFWLWGLAGGASVRHSVLTYVCVCVPDPNNVYLWQQDVSSRYLTPLVCMHPLAWTWAHAPACDCHLLCCCVVLSATFCSMDPESLVQCNRKRLAYAMVRLRLVLFAWWCCVYSSSLSSYYVCCMCAKAVGKHTC
jgi:hypothetical protein